MNIEANIGFIGGGNMATAIIGGLLKAGLSPKQVYVSDPDTDKCARLKQQLSVHCSQNAQQIGEQCPVIILAVKPQIMPLLSDELRPLLAHKKCLIISIAAGTPIASIKKWFGEQHAIIRVMPNTPALYSAGISGLFADTSVADQQRQLAEQIINATGSSVWVNKESDIDIVTAISGSGPAYFFHLVECLIEAGVNEGLSKETALALAKQTAYGAGLMMLKSDNSPSTLREQVTSPGGTTAAALQSFTDQNLKEIVNNAVHAAVKRGQELGQK